MIVAGCGSVGRWSYLPHLTKSRYVHLLAVCDIARPAVWEAAAAFRVPRWFTSARTMVKNVPADLFVNLTSMPSHGPLNLMALKAGLHVWSEKPIATNLALARRILREARRRKRYCLAAPIPVLSPAFAAAERLVRSGQLGKICQVRGRYGHGAQDMWAGWFFKKGGGSVFDLGVYNVTSLTGLLGPARAVTAFSGIAVPVRRLEGGKRVRTEVEDNTILLMDFGGARFGVVQSGFTFTKVDESDGHHTSSDPHETSIEVIGTKGSVRFLGYDWAPAGLRVGLSREKGWRTIATNQKGYTWAGGASYLAECLAKGCKPILTGEHAYHVLEVMTAAFRAAKTRRTIPVRSRFPWPLKLRR